MLRIFSAPTFSLFFEGAFNFNQQSYLDATFFYDFDRFFLSELAEEIRETTKLPQTYRIRENSFPMSHGGDVPISLAPIDLSFEKYSPRSRDKEAETQGNVQVISIIADGSDEIIGLLTS